LFDLEELFAFADDGFIPKSRNSLVSDVERALETVIK
jgi:hypothetical protein